MNGREEKNPFYVKNDRAMVSLGPLSSNKYCSYSCAFCYVQDGFLKYKKMCIKDICTYLVENKDKFSIIYVSGDTDSFAAPRTEEGIELLTAISEKLNKDVLFTTRMVFSEYDMKGIVRVNDILKNKNKNLYACISITSPNEERSIEPNPINTVDDRIKQLNLFKTNDIFSILAMRPFLPIYSIEQYKNLVLKVLGKVDCILGERWYFHENDIIYNRVMQGRKIDKGNVILTEMDFDDNTCIWSSWYDDKLENEIEELCKQLEIPFYMRSAPAIKYLKNLRGNNNAIS